MSTESVTIRPLLVARLAFCVPLGLLCIILAMMPILDWAEPGGLVFTVIFALLAGWCYRSATAAIRIEDDEVSFRGVLRTATFPLRATRAWEETGFNGSILLVLLLVDGSRYRVPLAVQGRRRQVRQLKARLQALGVAPQPSDGCATGASAS